MSCYSLAWVVVRITIYSFVMLLDLVSDISGQIKVLLDTVSDCSEDMVRSLVRIVSINDDTSHELPTVL